MISLPLLCIEVVFLGFRLLAQASLLVQNNLVKAAVASQNVGSRTVDLKQK
jgi:hypothetical protein